MKRLDDRILSAYIDGELSAAEAAELDRSLTPSERARLSGEMRFENALGEALRNGPGCPDALWEGIRQRVRTHSGGSRASLARRLRYGLWPLAGAAALLTVSVAVGAVVWNEAHPAFLSELPGDWVPVEVDANGAETFLHDHRLAVRLQTPESAGGHIRRAFMLGAREVTYKSEPVVDLLYECGGTPMKIVVARQGTAAARKIERAAVKRQVLSSRHVGNAVAAVVGRHPAPELINLLSADTAGRPASHATAIAEGFLPMGCERFRLGTPMLPVPGGGNGPGTL